MPGRRASWCPRWACVLDASACRPLVPRFAAGLPPSAPPRVHRRGGPRRVAPGRCWGRLSASPHEERPLRPTLLLFLAAFAAPVPAPAAAAAAASGTATGRPELLHSEPSQGAETHSLPTAVRLRFNQPMHLERLRVYDSGGVEHPVRVSRDAAMPS